MHVNKDRLVQIPLDFKIAMSNLADHWLRVGRVSPVGPTTALRPWPDFLVCPIRIQSHPIPIYECEGRTKTQQAAEKKNGSLRSLSFPQPLHESSAFLCSIVRNPNSSSSFPFPSSSEKTFIFSPFVQQILLPHPNKLLQEKKNQRDSFSPISGPSPCRFQMPLHHFCPSNLLFRRPSERREVSSLERKSKVLILM